MSLGNASGASGLATLDDVVRERVGVQVKADSTDVEELRRISEAGFGLVRIDVNWHKVEIEKGKFNFSRYVQFFNDAQSANLGVVAVLKGANSLYSELVEVDPKRYWGASRLPRSPNTESSRQAFIRYVKETVRVLNGRNVIWEVWNEPDWSFWFPKPNRMEFAALAIPVCEAIKEIAPGAAVIGPGLSKLPGLSGAGDNEFVYPLISSSRFHCFEALSVHPYREDDEMPETAIEDFERVYSYISKHAGQGVPLVNSEWGYSDLGKLDEELVAKYMVRLLLTSILLDSRISIMYEWKDTKGAVKVKERGFGLLRSDRTKKRSFVAVSTLLQSIGRLKISGSCLAPDEVHCLSFVDEHGVRSISVWSPTREFEGTLLRTTAGRVIVVSQNPTLVEIGNEDSPVLKSLAGD